MNITGGRGGNHSNFFLERSIEATRERVLMKAPTTSGRYFLSSIQAAYMHDIPPGSLDCAAIHPGRLQSCESPCGRTRHRHATSTTKLVIFPELLPGAGAR
jgi:hypothetical protein